MKVSPVRLSRECNTRTRTRTHAHTRALAHTHTMHTTCAGVQGPCHSQREVEPLQSRVHWPDVAPVVGEQVQLRGRPHVLFNGSWVQMRLKVYRK
jgi:hypothetical protein